MDQSLLNEVMNSFLRLGRREIGIIVYFLVVNKKAKLYKMKIEIISRKDSFTEV